MGAWNSGSFGNDTALDFADEVGGLDDLTRVLDAVGQSEGWIDSDLACEAVAAADMIAALTGRPAPDLPRDIAERLEGFGAPDPAVLAGARQVVGRVRDGSGLAELWREAEDESWLVSLDDLLARLDPDTPYIAPEQAAAGEDGSGEIGGHCHLCAKGIPAGEVIELTVEDETDGIWSSMTLFAHAECLRQHFAPPLFNDDGSPHENLLAQFAKSIEI
jgi:Domain of unknown function (DUF4259)